MQGRILPKYFETTIDLAPGREQDFGPYGYFLGQTVRVVSSSQANHYLGVFDQAEYNQFRTRGGRAPFILGSARTGHLIEYQASNSGMLYVVVRMSTWNFARLWPVRVSLEMG